MSSSSWKMSSPKFLDVEVFLGGPRDFVCAGFGFAAAL